MLVDATHTTILSLSSGCCGVVTSFEEEGEL